MTTTYTIEQRTQFQYEPISEGSFESMQSAIATMRKLESNLGLRDLRIVERYKTEDETQSGCIIAYGLHKGE